MGRYAVEMNRSGSSTLTVGTIQATTTTPRRIKVYDLTFGSEATPADNAFLWTLNRCNGAATVTGVTPGALDPADAASLADAGENTTVNPTITTPPLLSVPLNQRATFRFVSAPGSEFVAGATNDSGFVIYNPTASAVAVTATVLFEEQ